MWLYYKLYYQNKFFKLLYTKNITEHYIVNEWDYDGLLYALNN